MGAMRDEERAIGDMAVHESDAKITTMPGIVALRRGAATLNGRHPVTDLCTDVSIIGDQAYSGASRPYGPGLWDGKVRLSGSFSLFKG